MTGETWHMKRDRLLIRLVRLSPLYSEICLFRVSVWRRTADSLLPKHFMRKNV